MPVTNKPGEFGKVTNLSSSINLIPNQWGLVQKLGLFENKYGSQDSVLIPRTVEGENILVDRNWDERNPSIAGGQKDYISLPIPHYPVDDAITPRDIAGNIDFDALMRGDLTLETVEQKRAEKLERIRRAHSLTLELARMQVIKDGTVYAPNNTVAINYYTEWGIVRNTESVDLASTTVDPSADIEKAIAYLQDNLQTGAAAIDFICLCSGDFFSALIKNPFIIESYYHVRNAQQQPLLVDRLTASSPLDARYRTFDYAGVLFIEVRGSVGGIPYVEAGKAYMMPRFARGESPFETWFAPASRFRTINRAAQESYVFEYFNEKQDIIELVSETNFLNVVKRPDLIVTLENTSQ